MTPPDGRRGWVFDPKAQRACGERMRLDSVSKVICEIGEKAKVVVHVDARTKKVKYAAAHDFRRAYGDRWALRVMPRNPDAIDVAREHRHDHAVLSGT